MAQNWEILMEGLRPKQRRWVEHYIQNGGNATQAAKDAGYKYSSENSIAVRGAENIRKPKIKAVIDAYEQSLRQKTREKIEYTREDAIREYNEAIEIAKKKDNASAMCTAISGKAELCGLHQEPARNRESAEAKTPAELRQEADELEELARQANIIQMQVNRRTMG